MACACKQNQTASSFSAKRPIKVASAKDRSNKINGRKTIRRNLK